jgi:hypothetical protein
MPRENLTRWTSGYKLVKFFKDPQNEAAIKLIYKRHPDIIGPEDRLNNHDWSIIKKILFFLQALYNATLFTEGDHATLDRVLPTME